jgi:PKD repeat protein
MGYTVFSVKPVTVKGKKYGTGRNFAAGNFIQFKNKADAETAISKGAVVRCPFDPNKITMDLNAPLTLLVGQVVEIQPGNKHKGGSTTAPTYTINVTNGADTLSFNFTTTPAGSGTYTFGDGSSSTLGNGTASHSYTAAGTYTVTFTPVEGAAVSVDVVAVAVTPPAEPPAE